MLIVIFVLALAQNTAEIRGTVKDSTEDGETNVDLSVTKQFKVSEASALEFPAEIFNVFNFLNFVGAPGRIAFTPNFGRLFNAGPSRQVQFGLKLSF